MKYEIKTLIYLRTLIDTTIDNAITEYSLRGKETDLDRLKESIIYHIDDQSDYIKQNRRRKNDSK